MNTLADWSDHPDVVRLGWTLVHFVWQGGLVAGAWTVARQVLRRHRPQTRYLSGCLALALMAAVPLLTWKLLEPAARTRAGGLVTASQLSGVTALGGSKPAGGSASAVGGSAHLWMDRLSHQADAAMPWLAGLWLVGVAGLSLRLVVGWKQVGRLRRRGTAVAEAWLLDRLEALRHRMGVKRTVRLLKSVWVEVPTVAGWLRPVILLPGSSLTGLSPRQLELLVAHELAHIRRHDLWVNLAQVLLETLLFYHPAVWWVSRGVREEREHCCDDLAVEVCGDRMAYVDALASMEELRHLTPGLVLGAGGGSLLGRVRRLVGLAPDEQDWRRAAGGTLLLLALVAVSVAVVGWLFSPMRYEASARLQAAVRNPDPLQGAMAATRPDPDFLATAMESLRSRSLLAEVIKRARLEDRWPATTPSGSVVRANPTDRLRSQLTVRRIPPTGLIEVVVWAEEAELAATIANTLVTEFITRSVVQRQAASLDLLFFLKHQANTLETEVRKAEEDIRRHMIETRFVSFREESNGIGQALNATMVKWAEAMAQAQAAENALERSRQQTSDGKPVVTCPSLALDPPFRQVQLDLVRLETEGEALLRVHGEAHPSVVEVRARIEATRAALERMAKEAAAALEANARLAKENENLQLSLVRQWEERQMEWSKEKSHHDLLEAKANSSKALFNRVLERLNEIELFHRDQSSEFHFVDPADPPLNPVYPLHKPALLLLAGGVLVGLIGIALLRTIAPPGTA